MEEMFIGLILLIVIALFSGFFLGLIALVRVNRLRADLDALGSEARHRLRSLEATSHATTSSPAAPPIDARPATLPPPPTTPSAAPRPVASPPIITAAPAHPAPRPLPRHITPTTTPPPRPAPGIPAASAGPAWSARLAEQFVGTRLLVWIAALAIALAGIFLAKYSYEQGLLRPSVRLLVATLFGASLLGVAEFLRKRTAQIAQALAAASVAILFACILVGVYLDHLLTPITAAGLMVVVTALAVLFSLRHGPLVALLGLVGGFFTPVLISPDARNPAVETLYLVLLQAGLLLVSRRKQWWPLSLLTIAGAFAWALVWLLSPTRFVDTPLLGLFILLSLVAAIAATWAVVGVPEKFAALVDLLRWASVIASMGLLAAMLPLRDFTWLEWFFFGLLCAGCVVGARLNHRYHALAWLSAILSLTLLWVWGDSLPHPILDPNYRALGWVLLAFGSLFAVGGCLCVWRSKEPHAPALWAGLSVTGAIAYLLTAYRLLQPAPWPHFYGECCVLLALLYLPAAYLLFRHRLTSPACNNALGALSLGICALLALAAPIELDPRWLAVAFALELAAAATLHKLWCIPMLRVAVGVLLVVVVQRLLLNPYVLGYPFGDRPIFNWLLYGYGVPVIALAWAAAQLRRADGKSHPLAAAVEVAAVALAFAMICLQVHHYFHPQPWRTLDFDLRETATYTWLWLGLGGALLLLGHLRQRRTPYVAGCVLVLLGLGQSLLGQGLLFNPLILRADLGDHFLSPLLLYSFATPVILGLTLAWFLRQGPHAAVAHWAEVLSLALCLLLVTLLTYHHFFRSALAREVHLTLIQRSTFIWLWLAFGLALLLITRWRPRPTLRWSGFAVIALALLLLLIGPVAIHNPRWSGQPVGEHLIWNWLLYIYALPALLLMAIRGEYTRPRPADWVRIEKGIASFLSVITLLLVFVLVTLEVRQAFHGPILTAPAIAATASTPAVLTSQAELYTYSAAWIILGALLLIAGILTTSPTLRWASLAVLLLSVAKVFLYDMRQLGSLYRVVSFMGLGVSLLVLAYLYQKFVFREKPPAESNPTPTADNP
ncbi:MAG: DUF2339 domain-containing protein [Phycisphaeraceae bacterium]|nr:DUF2339 domain-containing protein [Phycisphaeraceae bacterium]